MARKQRVPGKESATTMKDVAQYAGVSIKTVSNVVNDYQFVSKATRSKVDQAIEELGYKVNMSARSLRRGRTGIVGLSVPDLQMPYFAQLSSLMIGEAKKSGLRIIVEPTLYSREGELDSLLGSQQSMMDGLIYSPLHLSAVDIDDLDLEYPMVLIGERIFSDRYDHIAIENIEGTRRATKYLLESGCRHVAVLGTHPGEDIGSASLRLQGYREALAEAGMPFDPALEAPVGFWHRNSGVEAMNSLLDAHVKVDGVVALNDMLASGAMHAIELRGLKVPEDISVIGFDNSEDSQYLSPTLTSIDPGIDAVARLSIQVLQNRIDGLVPSGVERGKRVFHKVSSSLVVRKSTRSIQE